MPSRPNILYVIMEDTSPILGCYGAPLVKTPHIDQFAAQGVRFDGPFARRRSASPSRSSIFTGCYQTFTGTHQHRTYAWNKQPLPSPVKHVCDWFREGGYFTCNLHPSAEEMAEKDPETIDARLWGDRGCGKVDLNSRSMPRIATTLSTAVTGRAKARPAFFRDLTILETHKGDGWTVARQQPPGERVKPRSRQTSALLPDDVLCREEYATSSTCCHLADGYVGRLMERLEREGLAQNTIVVISSDHGSLFPWKTVSLRRWRSYSTDGSFSRRPERWFRGPSLGQFDRL